MYASVLKIMVSCWVRRVVVLESGLLERTPYVPGVYGHIKGVVSHGRWSHPGVKLYRAAQCQEPWERGSQTTFLHLLFRRPFLLENNANSIFYY